MVLGEQLPNGCRSSSLFLLPLSKDECALEHDIYFADGKSVHNICLSN